MGGKTCPRCGAPIEWEGNPHRPFCSERCRLVDLEGWLGGRYAIPGDPVPTDASGDAPAAGESPEPPRKPRP